MPIYLDLLPDDVLDTVHKNVSMKMYTEVMEQLTCYGKVLEKLRINNLLIDILLDGTDEKVQEHFGENMTATEFAFDFRKEQQLAMLADEEFVKQHCVDPRISPENFALYQEFRNKYPRRM